MTSRFLRSRTGSSGLTGRMGLSARPTCPRPLVCSSCSKETSALERPDPERVCMCVVCFNEFERWEHTCRVPAAIAPACRRLRPALPQFFGISSAPASGTPSSATAL